MSMQFAGRARSGISPVTLIVVVIGSLIAVAIAFVMYTTQIKRQADLDKVSAEAKARSAEHAAAVDERDKVEAFLDTRSFAESIEQYYSELDMKGLTVEPRNFHQINRELDGWVHRLDLLSDDLDVRIGEVTKRADAVETARDRTRDDYILRQQQKNQELAQLRQSLSDELSKKDALVALYTREKQEFIGKYEAALGVWEDKKKGLLLETGNTKDRNLVDRRDLKVLRPEPSIDPPAGRIVGGDRSVGKVIIDLGERRDIFPGLLFEVYFFGTDGVRVVKAKIEVFQVLKETSIATVIASDPRYPIVEGDLIQTPFLPIPRKQRFVVAGFIPPDAIYDAEQMRTLIKLNGGEVQPAVNLYTDVLILGETSTPVLEGVDDKLREGLEAEAQTGRAAAGTARELSVDIVDYREFLESIRQ